MLKCAFTLGICLTSFSSLAASAQTPTFTTTSYSSNNLWNQNYHISADLNHDGREDFISEAGNWNCSGSFAVTLSTGDGAYAEPVCYTLPAGRMVGLAAGDFYSNTGNIDIAAGNDQGDLYIFRNAGNGALSLASTVTLPSGYSFSFAADINHDTLMDLVCARSDANGGGSIQVLFSNTGGTFTNGPVTTFSNMKEPAGQMAIGDFDGDGKADIVVSGASHAEAAILYGDGTGNFTPGPSVGGNSTALTRYQAFDFNSDGTMDLIGAPYMYANSSSATPTFFKYLDLEWGHFNRTLTSQTVPLENCAVSDNPPQIADFDGDGIADIVVAEAASCNGSGPSTLNFMKGNGDGTFQSEQSIYSTNDTIAEWHVIRASHSSKPDLTVFQYVGENNTITAPEELVLVNTTSGSFPACSPPDFGLEFRPAGFAICGPISTAVPAPTVNFSLATTNQSPVRDMEIWVDGQKVAENLKSTYTTHGFIQASVPLANGQHRVDLYSVGWDYSTLWDTFPLVVGESSCPVPDAGLNICSPIDLSQTTSPVPVSATSHSDSGISRMEIWVDGVKEYSTWGSENLNTQLTLPAGLHQFDYYAVAMDGSIVGQTHWVEVK